MQPLKVGYVFDYLLGLRMMLLVRFWYKGNHSLNQKCYVVCTFPKGKRLILDPESDFPCTRIETTTREITLRIQNATLFVRFRRGNAPFWIKRVISLVPESKQQENTGLCLGELRLTQSLVEGSRGIFESTS